MATLIVLGVVAVVVLITLARAIRIVPQARAGIVERLGRYNRTLDAGLALVIPYVDRVKPLIDLRETVVSFPPQPVITEDNLVINIDTVIYFQVTDPKAATYEIQDFIAGIEQLTVTTLRNVIGGMTLEDTLTSRDKVSAALRHVLDEATGKWGIRVNRVELKAVDPPASIQEAMEKQMRAERDRRAAILTAEGVKQSQILTAEGEKQSRDPARRGPARGADPARPRASRRRSRRSSRRSTAATPTRSCSPTSTSRCCRRSPRASRTRSGSSRARSRPRSRTSARSSRRPSRGRRRPRRIEIYPHRDRLCAHGADHRRVEPVRHPALTLAPVVVG